MLGGKSTIQNHGRNLNVGESVTVKEEAFDINLTLSVGDVQRNVVYTKRTSTGNRLEFNDGTFDIEGTYTKVKVNIHNNNNEEFQLSEYTLPMELLDSESNTLSECSYTILDNRLENEKLPYIVPGNSSISGYVYCKTDSNSGSILDIGVPSKALSNEKTLVFAEYKFKLK